jgi:predicted enzyme related to lactoylglutathione lyase
MTNIFDKNTAVWFEILFTDFNRAVRFYEVVESG